MIVWSALFEAGQCDVRGAVSSSEAVLPVPDESLERSRLILRGHCQR